MDLRILRLTIGNCSTFELSRPPGLNATNLNTWVAAIKAVPGRVPIHLIGDASIPITNFNADYYEIGNEMNYKTSPTPEVYAGYLKARYTEIKAAKPSAKVILGGTDSWQYGGSASKWLAKMMVELERMGLKPATFPFDIVGVHLYPHGDLRAIDSIPGMLKNVESWRWDWRVETKPVWCTEFGILQDLCIFRSMPRVIQADHIIRMMKHAKDGGCDAAIWYAADQNEMGLGTSQTILDSSGVSELQNSVATWNEVAAAAA